MNNEEENQPAENPQNPPWSEHTPNAPTFNVPLRSGRQVRIEDVTTPKLVQLCYKQLDRMKMHVFHLLMYRQELIRRDVELPDVVHRSIFDITQTSAMLGLNTFNGVQRDLYDEEE